MSSAAGCRGWGRRWAMRSRWHGGVVSRGIIRVCVVVCGVCTHVSSPTSRRACCLLTCSQVHKGIIQKKSRGVSWPHDPAFDLCARG